MRENFNAKAQRREDAKRMKWILCLPFDFTKPRVLDRLPILLSELALRLCPFASLR
jgi:hypothetical protein